MYRNQAVLEAFLFDSNSYDLKMLIEGFLLIFWMTMDELVKALLLRDYAIL